MTKPVRRSSVKEESMVAWAAWGSTMRWRFFALVFLILSLFMFVRSGRTEADLVTKAIFRLETAQHEGEGSRATWRGVSRGTAFFISSSGRALTNSHVVYRSQQDPRKYALLAVVGSDLYSAKVVCASPLPYDPITQRTHVSASRDIAVLQIEQVRIPGIDNWGYMERGVFMKVATAHWGALPQFESLPVADSEANLGAHVQIAGFGFQSVFWHPELWTASGTVTRISTARDGTEILDIESSLRAEPGHSGSPVIDDSGRVVGLMTWNDSAHADVSRAQGVAVLAHPCD